MPPQAPFTLDRRIFQVRPQGCCPPDPLRPRRHPRGQDGLRLHHLGRHPGEVLRRRPPPEELLGQEVPPAGGGGALAHVQLAQGGLRLV